MKRDRITRAVAGAAVASLVACFLGRRRGRFEEAREKLGRSEAQFRTIFEGMAVGVALVDARGRLVESNSALEEMLGYAGDELRGLHFAELTHPEDAEENLKLYEELLRGGRDHYRLEKRYVKKSGELLWGRLTASFLRGSGEEAAGEASGDPPLAIGILEDVTERRRTEEALRGSEERYRAVIEQSAEGIYLVDAETRRVFETNPSLQKMLGYNAGELRGMELYDLIAHPPEDVEYNLRRTLREGNRFVGERRYRRKDGSVVDVEVGVSVISYGSKEVVCVIVRDTTERKRVEEALKQSEERFHSLVENAGDAFFIHDLDGRFVDANQWACDSLGYTREELLGLSVADVEMGFDPAGLLELWGKVVAGTPITLDGAHRRKDGSTFPVEIRLGVFESDGRRLMLALARDVSEREKAQAALRESERRFRQLFEQSVDALLVHDEEGRVVDCNSEACRSLGYTREELLELSVKDFVEDLLTEEEKRELGENTPWRQALRGEPGATVNFHQNRHRRKDGTSFPVEVGVGSIDYGEKRLVFASARDITERRELEKRLSYQAFHDSLTGLPNRVLFLDRLGHALARADRREDSVAVLFLDLDDFKVVNDSLGHGVGDELLVATARRLTACLRPGDTVARLGGDEFTVLLEEVTGGGEVERVVTRILDGLAAPFEIAGSEVFVTASIGVVSEASPESSPEELMREADLAMYRAKEGGKARYEVYEEAMTTRAAERIAFERELRQGVRGPLPTEGAPREP